MKEKNQKKFDSQKLIIDVMEKNISTWQKVIELKNSYDKFVKNFKKINNCETELEKDTAVLYSNKEKTRSILIDKLFPVSSVMSVYAYDTGNKNLYRVSDLKLTKLEPKKGRALMKSCNTLIKKADKLLFVVKVNTKPGTRQEKKQIEKTIIDYGLTEKHVQELKDAYTNYLENVFLVKKDKTYRTACRKRVDLLLGKNEKILKNKLDKFLTLFQVTNKAFYTGYIRARSGEVLVKKPVAAKPVVAKPVAAKPAVAKKPVVKKTTTPTRKPRTT